MKKHSGRLSTTSLLLILGIGFSMYAASQSQASNTQAAAAGAVGGATGAGVATFAAAALFGWLLL